jgi:predicted Zn-dependent protease
LIRHAPGVLLLALLLGCAGSDGTRTENLRAGQRPALDSDEAGLWMAAEKSERAVRESGRVLDDAAINRYVSGVVCRLAPDHCAQIRVDVIRTPGFNASMSPNGHMQVWTGLLLRTENEDQLAYVLGHETGHFLRRHSVQRWRAIRATTDAASFFQILTAVAGVPVVGQIGGYAALGGLLAYSRDQEREADVHGLDLMTQAGYDASQAPLIWEALMREREAEQEPQESIFFATHPSTQERFETLRELAAARPRPTRPAPAEPSSHRAIVESHADAWLADELQKREYAANLVLLDRLGEAGAAPGLLGFYRAEVYRLRGEEGDDLRAVGAYRDAIALGDAPAQTHRSLGLVLWRAGRNAEARQAFEAYLAAAPDADDREMVASYLARIGD